MRRAAVLLAVLVLAGCGGTASTPEVALLTGVAASPDRVVFDFRSPPRTVSRRYATRVAESGSGAPVPVRGARILVVSFAPAATADLRGEQVVPSYTGPRRLLPRGAGPVREAVQIGDFEAQLDWAIGVDAGHAPRIERDGARVTVTFGD